MPEDFFPADLVKLLLKRWWLVVLLMIIGGAAGLFAHSLRPPIYEGRAGITFAIDLNQTGKITQFEEDLAINSAGALVYLPEVMQATLNNLNARGINLDGAGLGRMLNYERQGFIIFLRIRHPDPVIAAQVANEWAQNAFAAMKTAALHAQRAEALRLYLDGLERCAQQVTVTEPSTGLCSLRTLPALQQEMETTGALYAQERSAARSLIPALTLDWTEQAQVPTSPVQYERNNLALAGILIGLLLSMWVVAAQLPERLARQRRHG